MIFSSKTTSGNKTQVYSSIELQGLKLYGSNYIITHKGEIYKNLKSYWLTSSQLDKLNSVVKVETSDF